MDVQNLYGKRRRCDDIESDENDFEPSDWDEYVPGSNLTPSDADVTENHISTELDYTTYTSSVYCRKADDSSRGQPSPGVIQIVLDLAEPYLNIPL